MDFEYTIETLSPQVRAVSTKDHRFGTDAFLLAHFSQAKRRDIICDLGTGCGIIPLLLCRKEPPQRIYAVDIQQLAVRQLELAVELSGLQSRIVPMCVDLRRLSSERLIPRESIDLVTCNPPYKADRCGLPSQTPSQLLARHEVACSIGDVCACASYLLKYGGRLSVCQRPERLADVMGAMREHALEPKRLRFVAKAPGEEPWLFLLEARKGGNPFLRVMPELYVAGKTPGSFSDEMNRIYGFNTGKETADDAAITEPR